MICDALCYFQFCWPWVLFPKSDVNNFLSYIQHIKVRCGVRIIAVTVV
jgi:hypothetical protein